MREAQARILVVDDGPVLAPGRQPLPPRHGRQTPWVDEAAAVAAVQRQVPDLVLLDVMPPGPEEHDVCVRNRPAVEPVVLMLTALGVAGARVARQGSGARRPMLPSPSACVSTPCGSALCCARAGQERRRSPSCSATAASPWIATAARSDRRVTAWARRSHDDKSSRFGHITTGECVCFVRGP